MSHRHLIRLLPDGRAQWLAQDRAGRVSSGPAEGFPTTQASQTVVLVPAAEVLLLLAPRIARQRSQLEQAIPFAIEDQLVMPVEHCHVALAEGGTADGVTVAVVARERIAAWLATLAAHGIAPDHLLPESWLLPHASGPSLLLADGHASLRYAEAGMLAGEVSEAGDWLPIVGDSLPADAPLTLLGRDEELAAESASGLVWAAGIQRQAIASPLEYFASRLASGGAPTLDLLTGDYAPRQRDAGARRLWRWAAILALAAVGLGMGAMALERWQLERRHALQRAQMEALLREALPDVQRIVDPRAQMAGELARLAGHGGPRGALSMLAQIAPVLSGSGRYTLDAVEYRNGVLELTLRSSDVATLDELRERIVTLGLGAELVSMVPGSGGVEGKLRVRGAGA